MRSEVLYSVDLGSDDCETCGVNFNYVTIEHDEDGYHYASSFGCFGGPSESGMTRDELIAFMREENRQDPNFQQLILDLEAQR